MFQTEDEQGGRGAEYLVEEVERMDSDGERE